MNAIPEGGEVSIELAAGRMSQVLEIAVIWGGASKHKPPGFRAAWT